MIQIQCPCCHRPAAKPNADLIALALNLPPQHAAILRVVWRGRGQPIHHTQIIRAMYQGADTVPLDSYRAFKVALCHLRKKLRGTGYTIENVHYGCGYRLVVDPDRQKSDSAFHAQAVISDAEQRAA